jgi:hypothetical protein
VLDDLSRGDHTAESRDLLLDVFREKMATTEGDHVGRILDVTLRRRPAADKQRHSGGLGSAPVLPSSHPPARAKTCETLCLPLDGDTAP